MVNLIVGKKGTGKTKTMLDSVNSAVNSEHGNIVFINSGDRHVYQLIDSLLKVVDDNIDNLSDFVEEINKIGDEKKIKFTITISADKSELPESVYKYIV